MKGRNIEDALRELDEISRHLHGLSGHIEYIIDQIAPNWRKERARIEKKTREQMLKEFKL